MGFRLLGIRRASFTANQASFKVVDVPKGYVAVYVGEKMKRFVIPISYLNQPSFQDFKLRKNLGITIQWAGSEFLAEKMTS